MKNNAKTTKPEARLIVQTQTIRLFDFEHPLTLACGQQLAPVDVAYETYGELNAAGDNAILVIHALTGSAHAAYWHDDGDATPGWWHGLIGAGKALDPKRYFIVCCNLLGGCYGTTGPTSRNPVTSLPYGTTFPPLITADMARVQKALLDYLKVSCLVTVLGGSLGGMISWQFAVQYPECLRSAIPIAGTLAASPWVIALDEVARQAIYLDPLWQQLANRENNDKPLNLSGLKLARMIAMISYRSEISFAQRFQRQRLSEVPAAAFDPDNLFQIESYLRYQGEKLLTRFDPFTYLILTRAMDWHDVSYGFADLTTALQQIKAKILAIGINSDRLFTAAEMRDSVQQLQRLGKQARYAEIDTIHGHDAFLIEYDQLNRLIGSFLESL